MTRDEAVKIAYDDFGAGTHGLVDALVALGVLKLDEPQGVGDRACFAIWNGTFLAALDDAGLKIVEK